jgi:hypothetical protein
VVDEKIPRSSGASCEGHERSRNLGLRLRGFATRCGGEDPRSSASACGCGLDDCIMMDCSSRLASESHWTFEEILSVAVLHSNEI